MASEKPKHTKEHSKAKKHKGGAGHKKIFDIVPPGKSPAAPNSRSVIVGHKPKVADDQFVKNSETGGARLAGDPSEKRPLLDSHKKIELHPDDDESGQAKVEVAGESSGKKGKSGKDNGKADKIAVSVSSSASGSSSLVTTENAARAVHAASGGSIPTAATAPLMPKSLTGIGRSTASAGVRAASSAPTTETESGVAPAASGRPKGLSASELLADLAVEHTVEPDDLDELQEQESATTTISGSGLGHGASASSKDVHIDASGQLSHGVGTAVDAGSGSNGRPTGASGANIDLEEARFPASGVPGSASGAAGADYAKPKTVDDLLAESSAPELAAQKAIVSTHRHGKRSGTIGAILIFLLVVIVAAIALDILLDAGVVRTGLGLPYTDFL